MFNALSSEELLIGVGRVLRAVAGADGALEEYVRSQALSAYSITRLLAAEQADATRLLAHTKQQLLQALDGESDAGSDTERARQAIGAAETANQVGDAVSDLLAGLPHETETRDRVHGVLAEMVNAEVAALAAARR